MSDSPFITQMQRCAATVRWVIVTVVIAVLLTGCATTSIPTGKKSSSSTTRSGSKASSSRTATVASSTPGHLAWSHIAEPEVADTALGLYLDWLGSPQGVAPIVSALARVNRSDGHIEVVRNLEGGFSSALTAAGSLWVTTSSASGLSRAPGLLWRLDPKTLKVRERIRLPSTAGGASMAIAGGSLWVAAGPALVRVSLPGGGLSAIVSLGDAISSSVAADSTGKVLVLGEANNAGTSIIERRNPTTGTLLAASTPLHGVFTPLVGRAIDGTAWVSESTGMMGYVQHYSLEPLAPIKPTCKAGMIAKTCVTGSNGLRARVVSRLVWLTQQAGGPSRNACVDPANGDILSPIALPMVNDQVLAIAARYLFIVSQPLPGSGSGQTVTEEPIPAACHAG